MRIRRYAKRLLLLSAVLGAGFAGGCARQPPGSNALSGKLLIVTMVFRAGINPNFHYFFLMNNAGSQSAPGPVPVFVAPYGNGFATGSGGGTAGFTDFVRYDAQQPQAYGLYHAIGNPNASNFVYEGRPVSFTVPDPNNPNSSNQLQFAIDLSQLIVDSNGNPLSDQTQAANMAKTLQWLQVNMISTDIIPRDVSTTVEKQVDSMGDDRTSAAASSFLIVDLTQNRTVHNSDFVGQLVYEPADPDVFGGSDPTLDLVDWSIQVQQN